MAELEDHENGSARTTFKAGNGAAMRHGATSERQIVRRATVEMRRMLRQIGLRQADLESVGRALLLNWARAAAALFLMDEYAQREGWLDKKGEPRGFARLYISMLNTERLALKALGEHLRSREADPVGFFADLYGTVEKGDLPDAVCAHATTMEARPGLADAALQLERRRDPEGYRAEYLAEFVAAGGAFIDPVRLDEAVARKGELRPGDVTTPIAAIDLAFVHDASALAIVGRDRQDPRRLRLVLTRSWAPRPGAPLSPNALLGEMAALCREHGVAHVYTDQHYAEHAREELGRLGLMVEVVSTTPDSKSEMFASLKTRVYENGIELYQQEELLAELRRLETASTPGRATVRIRRLGSSHGDLVTALALACSKLRGPPPKQRTSVPRGSWLDYVTPPAGSPYARGGAFHHGGEW